jgi:C4-dicarboxylate transporter, DctM subunit
MSSALAITSATTCSEPIEPEMTSFLTLFAGLLATGMPVFLMLGLCAGAMFVLSGQPLVGAAQLVINELNSPTLMALPLFVMAAAFMRFGGIAHALVNLSTAWLGGLPGSLGLVTVVACTLFAAICGSSVATAMAMGTILIPAMLERGYPLSFALGVVGASGTIGIVIPPSLPLILYGIVAEQSVPRLFLAGILPGLLQAAAFFFWVLYEARRRKLPVEPVLPFKDRLRVTLSALPALLVPLVVMVGIYGGFVTVTEAAALSAVTALFVSLVFYRGFHWTDTLTVVANGLRSAASIMLIIATALALGHWVTESGAPARLIAFLLAHQLSTWQFLLAINVLLLVLGCFLEVTATLLLVLPVLAPALRPMGVDPVHFSIIFTHNMEIGLVHPPVGLNLFVLSSIAVAPMGAVIRGILPFLVILLMVLAVITYLPELTLWLPDATFGR